MNVTAGPVGDGWLLVVGTTMPLPPAAVWGALTDQELLAEWSPMTAARTLPDGEPDDGDDGVTLSLTAADELEVELTATVLEADPPWLLAYRWGTDHVRWRLTRTDDGTRLTLEHQVTRRADLARAAAGWHVSLARLTGDPELDGDWPDLHARYTAAFGA